MTPRLLAALAAALAAAAGLGVGIGIGAAIWQGDDAPAAPAAAPARAANATSSWLFVVTADAGVVTATGNDLTIVLRGVPPASLAFTDRPALQAAALNTSAVADAVSPDAAEYAAGDVAPLNAALAFSYEGAAVALPVTILAAAGAGGNYTLTARAMPAEGGDPVAVQGGAAVRGTSSPLWAAMQAGLELEAPTLFVDGVVAMQAGPTYVNPYACCLSLTGEPNTYGTCYATSYDCCDGGGIACCCTDPTFSCYVSPCT